MNITAIRLLALGAATAGLGVAAIVTPVGGAAVTTRGIWVQWPDETMPVGRDLATRGPRRVFGLATAAVPTLPKGSIIVAAPPGGTVAKTWKVDGIDRYDADQWRAIVAAVD